MKTRIDLFLANAAAEDSFDATATLIDEQNIDIGTANAADADGWIRLSGYGNYPIKVGDRTIMQIVDAAAANAISGSFQKAIGFIKRLLGFGNAYPPVYNGHPDVPAFSAHPRYGSDHTVYARIEAIEARADGIYGKFAKTPEWTALANSGPIRVSPYWGVSWADAAQTKCRPVKLLSVGLVDRPNMADAAYANAISINSPQEKTETAMNKHLIKALTLLGFADPRIQATANAEPNADAVSLTEIEEAFAAANAAAVEEARPEIEAGLANGLFDVVTALLKAIGMNDEQIDAVIDDKASQPNVDEIATAIRTAIGAESQAEVAAANAALTELRSAHAETLVESAIANGIVTLADRDTEVEALANAEDFTAAAEALANREPVLPRRQTGDLGKRKQEQRHESPAKQLVALANAALDTKEAKTFEDAYALVKRRNPDLVEEANKPKTETE